MAGNISLSAKRKGAGFLVEDISPAEIFVPEDLNEEHHAIERMTEEFWKNEVEPKLPAIWRQEPGAALTVLRKAAELGLTAISIPERFGGMEMDLASAIVLASQLGRDASYSLWHTAHTGIGTLPLVFFGTEEQKQRYLPRLARLEMLAAYALTEPLAGSDALAIRTRADMAPDGKHYILNGQKAWITNGSAADLFTVFAKVDGDKFTAFLVERSFPGVASGAEEHKMGLKGSSTTAVYFDNVPVPVNNVLGEIGRGHVIAFNVLNLGRLKLGAATLGSAKQVLGISLKYAKQRKAFGGVIAEFGAIQHKLAEMAIRMFVAEAMVWRTVGLIEAELKKASAVDGQPQAELKALEEYAVECSAVKVWASEMLDYVVDEGVQIHGGYGYHQDYAVERAYRDSRINRIFEGTNEINRLLIPALILKRVARGLLPSLQAVLKSTPSFSEAANNEDEELRLVHEAKQLALFAIGLSYQKYQAGLEKNQEVSILLANMVIEVFAMESCLLRARKLRGLGEHAIADEICAVFLRDAMNRIELWCRELIGTCCERSSLGAALDLLRQRANHQPVDAITLRRNIARRLLASESYKI